MTAEEAREYWSSVTEILDRHNLRWILEQAEEKIALGRLITKKIDAAESVQDPITGGRRREPRKRMAEFLTTERYSETEKLGILLDAIDLGLVSPARIEREIAKNLEYFASDIHFIPDDSSTDPTHTVEITGRSDREQFAKTLEGAIDKIRSLL